MYIANKTTVMCVLRGRNERQWSFAEYCCRCKQKRITRKVGFWFVDESVILKYDVLADRVRCRCISSGRFWFFCLNLCRGRRYSEATVYAFQSRNNILVLYILKAFLFFFEYRNDAEFIFISQLYFKMSRILRET